MALSRGKSLVQGTTSLLNSEKYSDLTITTQKRSFKVHKAIVCTQSRVLAAMSDGGFKETSTSVLQLNHDDPATVERMITFLYTGTYDPGAPEVPVQDPNPFVGPILMANTLVYSIADKYDIEGLKALAKLSFEAISFAAWDCEDFPAVVDKVFDTTPESDLGLRDVVSVICAKHIDELLVHQSWIDLLSHNGAVGLSIFKAARKRSVEEVEEAKDEVKECEKDIDWLESCNDRLHKRFDEAHGDLKSILDKWDVNRGRDVCKECWDGLYEGLVYDLADFKKDLPNREESAFL